MSVYGRRVLGGSVIYVFYLVLGARYQLGHRPVSGSSCSFDLFYFILLYFLYLTYFIFFVHITELITCNEFNKV